MSDPRIDCYFQGGQLVVDLGCGDGTWLDSVSAGYERALGLDISAADIATRGVPADGWKFTSADLNAGIPLGDSEADAVRANQVIEHIANPLFFVEEARRVLRPGGIFVATTPNIRYARHIGRLVLHGAGPLTSGGSLRTRDVWDDGHIHFFTTGDLEWLAVTAGFGKVRTQALVDTDGRTALLRRALDRLSSNAIVKGFLTGNIMLVAWK